MRCWPRRGTPGIRAAATTDFLAGIQRDAWRPGKCFEQQALQLIAQIPPGRVSSYGRIAARIPPPPGMDPNGYRRIAARKVGTALRNLGRRRAGAGPAAAPVPWHRVLNHRGCSSLDGPAADLQLALLEAENVPLDDDGCVDMARYGWDFTEGC